METNLYKHSLGIEVAYAVTIDAKAPDMALLDPMDTPCKHPKVRIVAREEDVEFVECQECGEVFDSDEFRDMEIEAKAAASEDSLHMTEEAEEA